MSIFTRPTPLPAAAGLALAAALLGACGGGGGGGGTTPPPSAATVTISGQAQYEFVPPNGNCQGLNFNAIETRPIRQATVEALRSTTGALLDSTVTDDEGNFAVSVDADTQVFLRVRAELKRTGSPAWNVEVRDNFDDSEPPEQRPSLGQRPLYVLDGTPFDSGASHSTRNLTAATGWGGSSYDATRAAAPFAILDSIYSAMRLVLAEDPQIAFAPLDAFWSVNNVATNETDIDLGELPTSFYSGNRLFLLGMDGVDTEEFDDHVIAHEWGHYFEDRFSRSDSIGGSHSPGDRLDMRVAFGEGWATALAGMALDDPDYCDTLGAGNQSGFRIGIDGPGAGEPGWFNELSVMQILYDLWDDGPADDDGMSLGFTPIYNVMAGAQAETPAFTSIFSFAAALKAENPDAVPFIDALLTEENITAAGIDAYGSSATNDAVDPGDADDVLPVYTAVPDGTTFEICSNSQFDRSGTDELLADGNKLSESRFLRMTLDAAAQLEVEILTSAGTVAMLPPDDPDDDRDQSDPDILIFRAGEVQNLFINGDTQGLSGDANREAFTTPDALPPGDYVMSLTEFRYQDTETPADYPPRSCFDVTITAIP